MSLLSTSGLSTNVCMHMRVCVCMCVCVCACACVHIVLDEGPTICLYSPPVACQPMCVCVHACACVCMHVCMLYLTRDPPFVSTLHQWPVNQCVCVCMCVCVHACACVHAVLDEGPTVCLYHPPVSCPLISCR